MSRILFWYVFKDLIRVFLLASGVIAGIMSFGGLLRPLTHHGLDVGQVSKMLTYLMPAMTTYSLPIAALFATTIVYGRLSADNELTACRAAGVSHLAVATPALLLGILVAILSLLFLCFIVPAFSFKVQKVIYSNIGQLIVHDVERSHELRIGRGGPVIFAQYARLLESDDAHPREQTVVLQGPAIITKQKAKDDAHPELPREFFLARQAMIHIRQLQEDGEITVYAQLDGGATFPRDFAGGWQAGVEATEFGPITYNSPIREDTRFMDIVSLKRMYRQPGESQDVRKVVAGFVRKEQQARFMQMVVDDLNARRQTYTFATGGEKFELYRGSAKMEWRDRDEELVLSAGSAASRPIRMTRRDEAGHITLTADANEVRLRFVPDNSTSRMAIGLTLSDAMTNIGDDPIPRASFLQTFSVPMSDSIRQLTARTPDDYRSAEAAPYGDQNRLAREVLKKCNQIVGEIHGRASFAISCLILVMIGSALGMMFKSGNFLSAFAVSVIPALLCITLIGAGQQMVESLPDVVLKPGFRNPLEVGLAMIWSGNVIVLLIASTLLYRLQRQ